MLVRLPIPNSETIKRFGPCISICIATTSSLSSIFMPRTPIDVRPVVRTSFSLKRIHCPLFVTRKMSRLLSVTFTSINSFPSRRVIACKPVLRIFAYSKIGVFLTVPSFVAMKRYLSSSNSLMEITAEIFSSGSNCKRLIIAVPLDVRLASGIS